MNLNYTSKSGKWFVLQEKPSFIVIQYPFHGYFYEKQPKNRRFFQKQSAKWKNGLQLSLYKSKVLIKIRTIGILISLLIVEGLKLMPRLPCLCSR